MESLSFKDYFIFSPETGKTICTIDGCDKMYSGYRTTNLWRHLQSVHGEIYERILPERQVRKKTLCENFVLDMRKAMVELCTVNGRPFSIIEDSGLVQILKVACNTAGEKSPDFLKLNISTEFNQQQLKMDIDAAYSFIQMQISSEVENILVSLMVDIRSKRGKSILGMQIQYIKGDQIKIRTIGMIRMLRPHTGAYIAELIENKLKEYNISLDQIYSLTTDNGANMLKAVSLVGNSVRDMLATEQESDELDPELLMDTTEFETLAGELSLDTIEDTNFTGLNTNDMLNQAATIMLAGNNAIEYTIGLSCGAHTLQLEIFASIKQWEVDTGLLSKCRAIMSKLRNQNIVDILVSRKLNLPITDCNPRWWTFYLMVSKNTLILSYQFFVAIFFQ